MEFGPHNQSQNQETLSAEKKESKKSKKKDAEKLGAFAVEAKPAQKDKKTTGWWERLSDSETPAKPERKIPKDERSPNDKTPELSGEAPLEHLSEVELTAVAKDLAHGRRNELAAELAEAAAYSPAADQAKAADAFLARAEASGDPAAAYEAAWQEFDTEPADDRAITEGEVSEQSDEPAPLEQIIDPHQAAEGELPLGLHRHDAAPQSGVEADADQPELAAGGGATTPPSPPRHPTIGGSVDWAPQPPIGGGFNTAPSPITSLANPNVISVADAYRHERRAQQRGLLVGGIVGYLIGRRRGRIKTEKRLLPVQKKLEQEVLSLQTTLLEREGRIRQAAAERRQVALSPASERLINATVEQKRQTSQAHRPSSERIGHVLMAAEGFSPAREAVAAHQPLAEKLIVERPVSTTAVVEKLSIEKQIITMPRGELLAASEKIVVEGTTLRQIYETHLIGERGLRRLVAEHLSGGNIERALRRELVEREIDYERDPVLRDRARASLTGGGKGALNSLVQRAGAVAVLEEQVKALEQTAARNSTRDKPNKRISNHHVADVALVSAITVLLAIIIILLTRGQ